MESLDLTNKSAEWKLETVQLPYHTKYTQALVIKNRVYICTSGYPEARKTVITWAPGETQWSHLKAEMSVARGSLPCSVTDHIDKIYVIGGCEPEACGTDDFIEQYSLSQGKWQGIPNSAPPNKNAYYVRMCAFWKGMIYAIFSSDYLSISGLNKTFHLFNTSSNSWQVSATELRVEAYFQAFTVVPN